MDSLAIYYKNNKGRGQNLKHTSKMPGTLALDCRYRSPIHPRCLMVQGAKFWRTNPLTFVTIYAIIIAMRLKNVPFKKSLKDDLRSSKSSTESKTYLRSKLKETIPEGSVEETKEIIKNLRRIWGSSITKK